VRLIIALVFAAVPIIPAATSAGAGSVPVLSHRDMSDVVGARKEEAEGKTEGAEEGGVSARGAERAVARREEVACWLPRGRAVLL
jgi:hypothetical protein